MKKLENYARVNLLGAAALIVLLLGGCGGGAEAPRGQPTVASRAGSFELRLWLDPDPPKQEGSLWVELRDSDGAAVEGADMTVGWLMPAMGAMAEMRGEAEIEEKGSGLYRASLDLPMVGSWTLSVNGRTPASLVTAEYSLNVGTRGLRELAARELGSAQPARSGTSGSLPATRYSSEVVEAQLEHVHDGAAGDEIAHYTCSMHPSVKRDAPGTCPICSMGLVPVTRREVETGVFVVGAGRRQEIGVRTEVARVEAVRVPVRAVGKVVYDESRLSEVTLKYKGWVGKLHVDRTGEHVQKGQVLFELYSPDLYATQEELLAALDSQRAARGTTAPHRADYLVDAAKQRLRLWDLSDEQIDEVSAGGKPIQYLPVLAPTTGYVIEKHVVEGSAVEPGQTLYRLAGLDRVWIEAVVYEAELALIEVGQSAEVTLPYLPGRSFEGKVSFVYPYLEGASRAGIVRLEFANPNLDLKPEMYANVLLLAERGERLTVSEEAVLYAGDRRLVFVDLGEGRLEPRTVEVGIRSHNRVEIVSGLEAGEIVVTSGNFLIAAESRLKSATGKW